MSEIQRVTPQTASGSAKASVSAKVAFRRRFWQRTIRSLDGTRRSGLRRGSAKASVSAKVEPEALAPFFRVLGDPTRLRILRALLEGERTVSDLVEITGAPQSRVSNHLACLKWCRMVEGRRQGRTVRYRICDPSLERLLRDAETVAAAHAEYLASCTRIGPDWI